MTLNLDAGGNAAGMSCGILGGGLLAPKKPGGLSLGLPLEISSARISADLVDVELPLERQGLVYRDQSVAFRRNFSNLDMREYYIG